MKRTYLYIVAILISFSMMAHAQSPCGSVSVEVIAMNPQSGPHNYFGVRVFISQAFYQNIIVTGYIWDGPEEHGYNTNHPYTLTIVAGYLSAETPVTFYETGPAAEGSADITSVSICPDDQAAESILLNINNVATMASLTAQEDSTGLSNFFVGKATEIDNYIQWKYGYNIHENYDTSTTTATMIIGLLYFAKENNFYINESGTWVDPSYRIDPMDCFVTVLGDLIGLTTIAALYSAIVNGGSASTIKQFLKGAIRRVFAIISIGIAVYDLGHDCLGWWSPRP